MTEARHYDLQDRLIDYAVRIIALSEALPAKADFVHKHKHRNSEEEHGTIMSYLGFGYSVLAVGY